MKKYISIITLILGIAASTSSFAAETTEVKCASKQLLINGKCIDTSNMCPKGQVAKMASSGVIACEQKLPAISCTKKQYWAGNKCLPCPANATCDAIDATCNQGYVNVAKSIHEIICARKVCPDGQILVKGTCVAKCPKKTEYLAGQECKACPANATCDGVDATCNQGYVNVAKSIHEIICRPSAQKCAGTQYLLYGKCTACPANATCNGQTATCKSGYSQEADKTKGITCILTKCKTNQYLLYGKCAACPANATCNGRTATCKSGYAQGADKTKGITCILKKCKTNQYLLYGKCTACPANATCNGQTATCKSGYAQGADKTKGITCILKKCKTNQYIVGTTCVACPKGATCDGKNPKCPNGYTKDAKGYVTCKVKQCKKGSHVSIDAIKKANKGCTNCGSEDIAVGQCDKNKKAHKHYYCDCNC